MNIHIHGKPGPKINLESAPIAGDDRHYSSEYKFSVYVVCHHSALSRISRLDSYSL